MKKQIKTLLTAVALLATSTAIANTPNNNGVTKIDMTCQKIDTSVSNSGIPRTPVQMPNVLWEQTSGTLYFENPCYECTLELIISGSETVAYSYSIPQGDDTVSLPEWLSGQYELHIHRGNFCFWGLIEL